MRLWLPLIGPGGEEEGYRAGIDFDDDKVPPRGVTVIPVAGGFCIKDPESARYGHPIGSEYGGHILIEVADDEAPAIMNAIPEDQVPQALRFCCAIIEGLELDVDGVFLNGEKAATAFFAEAQKLTGDERAKKATLIRALKEAADRGLRIEDVERIGGGLGLIDRG